MEDIKELTPQDLGRVLSGWQEKSFHARQILSWIYKRGAKHFEAMSDLPADLRRRLKERFYITSLKVIRTLKSEDGTEKFLLELKDKNVIEAVSIPTETRVTGCISTQAGCKFACSFCASGKAGFRRNLTCGEMLEEILYLKDDSAEKKLTHLVFMGTGEPLDNYAHVLQAIRIVNSEYSLNIGARRITISTCGIIPAIQKLAGEGLQIELSISLHAADEKTRSQLLPINKVYPLKGLIAASREYIEKTNRQITFEYILIKGVNSDLQSAQSLSKILHGLNCKVNLIPVNPTAGCRLEPPNKLEALLFKNRLAKSGINATLRRPRGKDIEAACGQLRLEYGG